MGVTIGGEHLEDTTAQLEDGDIEGTAAEVIHRDLHVLVLLVQAIGQGSGRRLVDDTLDIQSRDAAGLLGGLTLGVGEVGRDGDDRFGHVLTEVLLGRLLHLLENHGGDLLRRIELAVDVHAGGVVLAADHLVRHPGDFLSHTVIGLAHEPLDGEHGVVRVGDGLALGRVADLALTAVGESDDGRGGALSLVIDNDGRLVAFHHGHARVRGSKVDSDNLSHNIRYLFVLRFKAVRCGRRFPFIELRAKDAIMTKCHYLCTKL